MKRIEKTLKKELNENEDAVNSMMDYFASSFEMFRKNEEKEIAKAEANIQKILTDIANNDPDDVIKNLYEQYVNREESLTTIDRLESLQEYLFSEIAEHKVVKGLKK